MNINNKPSHGKHMQTFLFYAVKLTPLAA